MYSIVVDKRGRIVAESPNRYDKSHTRMASCSYRAERNSDKCYLHAEMAALIKSQGKGVKLYVARVGRDGTPRLAMPCPACSLAILEHGNIRSVEYTI